MDRWTKPQIIALLAAVLVGLGGWGARVSGYVNPPLGVAMMILAGTGLLATLIWAFWPSLKNRLHRWKAQETAVELTPENGPGKVFVRVENLGETSEFTASARMLLVEESVDNPPFAQTFALRWASTGRSTLTMPPGGADVLLIATSHRESHRESGNSLDLHEVRLEGLRDGKPEPVDWRRWNAGDPDGAVTITLEVTVSSGGGSQKGLFRVRSKKWGGISIEATPSEDPLAPRTDS